MKKLILLALALVMCGCEQAVTDYGIVKKVELCEVTKLSTSYTTKYRVTVSGDFNAQWSTEVHLYTNTLFNLGDTIQITKKN